MAGACSRWLSCRSEQPARRRNHLDTCAMKGRGTLVMSITIISSGRSERPVPVPGNAVTVAHVNPQLKLVSGTLRSDRSDWYEEPLEKGVKLILIQSGELRCWIPGQPEQRMKGPSLCLIANDIDCTTRQIYATHTPLHYTIVQLGPEVMAGDGALLPSELHPDGGDPRMVSCAPTKALRALSAQIATCTLEGSARDFYLAGKALELTALSAHMLSTASSSAVAPIRLNPSDVDRIYAARDLLLRDLQTPPSLEGLASQVGTNARKLSAGFQHVLGTSVFSFLTEARLLAAHQMLCDEEASVSTVAYRVGYSPAHFSVAFRKRFGISPSEIRQGGTLAHPRMPSSPRIAVN
jgi:AraC family transcriptional regulator, transcriptional activator of the genes for pyochelin and ferripyochelin receptors